MASPTQRMGDRDMITPLRDEGILEALNEVDKNFQSVVYQSDRRIAQEARRYTLEQIVKWLIANYSCEQKLVIIPEDELKKLGG